MRPAVVLVALAVALSLAPAADPPAAKDGWVDLLKPDVWKKVDPKWVRTDAVALAPGKTTRLAAAAVPDGEIWMNGAAGRADNLVTKADYGDCELHAEFLIAKGANSGVKFHGLYEIQILDTAGKDKLTGNSLGGIYPRAKNGPPYGYLDDGVPPKVNAARPAGEWQTLDATWTAPKFDAKGKKTAPGRIVKATLNGKVIHENVVVNTPTGANWVKSDTPNGPIMLQGDHGPVAFREVRVRPRRE